MDRSSIGSPTYSVAKYLVTLLQPNIGLRSSYVKDSSDIIQNARGLEIGANDILVSFLVVSLFIQIPLHDTLQYMKDIFPENIIQLFHYYFTTSYFQWDKLN